MCFGFNIGDNRKWTDRDMVDNTRSSVMKTVNKHINNDHISSEKFKLIGSILNRRVTITMTCTLFARMWNI